MIIINTSRLYLIMLMGMLIFTLLGTFPVFGKGITGNIFEQQLNPYNNPASLAFANKAELGAMSLDLHKMGISFQSMALVCPYKKYTFILASASNDYQNAGFEYIEKQLSVGLATTLNKRGDALGIIAKPINSFGQFDVLGVEGKGLSFNIGFEGRRNRISYGVAFENIGFIRWSFDEKDGEKETSFENLEKNMALNLDVNYGKATINFLGNTSTRQESASVGVSYKLDEQLKVKACLSNNSKISCGISINLGFIIADYSIIINSLGTTENTHVFATRFII